MRTVPLVFCLLRNPQPLLPKIWQLHSSNSKQHWQLLILHTQWASTFQHHGLLQLRFFFLHHCHLNGGSYLSANVPVTYHRLLPRTITDTPVQIQWNPASNVTRPYKQRGCRIWYRSFSIIYAWWWCASPANLNGVVCYSVLSTQGEGLLSLLEIWTLI